MSPRKRLDPDVIFRQAMNAHVEDLKDSIYSLAAELGYAPPGIDSGRGSMDALIVAMVGERQLFNAPDIPPLRERRKRAEAAGWTADRPRG